MKIRYSLLSVALLGLTLSSAAYAGDMSDMKGMNMSGNMSGMDMSHDSMKGMMMGMHMMPATVDKVDHNTGIVDLTSEGMKLRVHFPPASLQSIKDGEKIVLHLGFMPAK